MPKVVSEQIYRCFFDNLSQLGAVSPETLDAVQKLHQSRALTDKKKIAELVKEIEARHAKDQLSQGSGVQRDH